MDARITREETALLLNLRPAITEIELIRADALRARDAAVGQAIGRAVGSVFRAIGATLRFIGEYPQRARVLRHLAQLSDRELADIGLSRADLARVFDEDFAAARTRQPAAKAPLAGTPIRA
jgi:uncharacterized protein YjiS (DUF1127 family)